MEENNDLQEIKFEDIRKAKATKNSFQTMHVRSNVAGEVEVSFRSDNSWTDPKTRYMIVTNHSIMVFKTGESANYAVPMETIFWDKLACQKNKVVS